MTYQIGEHQTMEDIRKVYEEFKNNTTWDGRKGNQHISFDDWLPSYLGQFNVRINNENINCM
jgi:hypothetical protein